MAQSSRPRRAAGCFVLNNYKSAAYGPHARYCNTTCTCCVLDVVAPLLTVAILARCPAAGTRRRQAGVDGTHGHPVPSPSSARAAHATLYIVFAPPHQPTFVRHAITRRNSSYNL